VEDEVVVVDSVIAAAVAVVSEAAREAEVAEAVSSNHMALPIPSTVCDRPTGTPKPSNSH
jgi:hypothetical protein